MSTEEKAVHTPGPWKAELRRAWHVYGPYPSEPGEAEHVALLNCTENAEANARLIASATELPHQCDDPECHGGKLYQQHCLEIIRLGEVEAVNKELLQFVEQYVASTNCICRLNDIMKKMDVHVPCTNCEAKALIAKARAIRGQ